MRDNIFILNLIFTSKKGWSMLNTSILREIKKFCSVTAESKTFFFTIEVFNIDHPFRTKSQVKNKYTIPNKNLKITINYKKID